MHSLYVQALLAMTELEPTGLPSTPVDGDLEDQRLFSSVRGRLFGREGTVKIGRYRLEGRLGAGAMGEVFLGRDPQLDRLVAIKLVRPHLTDDRWAARMRREAKALARLAHPNVVHVYEVDEHEGRVFLAMEYVRGQSLREWIGEAEPSWSQVIEAYVQAGRGLAAAHAAGLTHRDFKPDNVLRHDDGRIQVADFGLAHLGDPTPRDTEPMMSRTDVQRSQTGGVKGTPAYMPPEQFEGHEVDGQADQFAFCVSLYEGLWGQRPFQEDSRRARIQSGREGPEAPSDRKGVPDWVWPVLARGLAASPSDRWPSMDELLEALEAIPRRRRRRRQGVVLGLSLGLTAGVAGLVGAIGWSTQQTAQTACEHVGDELDGVWDEARRQQVRRAFEATGTPVAVELSERVGMELDAWSARWIEEQARSCQATRTYGTQSEAMLDRRTACLQRKSGEVRALVDVLADADADALDRVGPVLDELPDLGACSVAALDAGAVPAIDDAVRDEVDAGYEALAQAHAQIAVGQPEHAIALAEQAQARGRAAEHAPLTLEARAALAEITIESGKLADGLEALRQVMLAAERAELFDLVADLRVALAREAAGDFAEPRLERWLIDEAQLALERVARPLDPRPVQLQSARARIAEQAGDYPAAIAAYERAYALAEGRLDETRRALLRAGIGSAMFHNRDYTEAREELERALEIARAAWGPRAPEVSRIEFNLGLLAGDLGDLPRAQRHLDSALAIDRAVWGSDSIEVARDRFALASIVIQSGDLDKGCEVIEQVLTVYEVELGSTHDETAEAINAHAVCRYHAGDLAGAIEAYRKALAVQEQLLGKEHPTVAQLHANIGESHFRLGELDESLAAYERAYEVFAATRPANDPLLATPLLGQALVRLQTGQESRALEDLERAYALVEQPSAQMSFALARALVAVHGRREGQRALALARQALEGFEQTSNEPRARAVRLWLAEQAD